MVTYRSSLENWIRLTNLFEHDVVFFGWAALGVLGVVNIEVKAISKLLKNELA
jgi:hypothetical protein